MKVYLQTATPVVQARLVPVRLLVSAARQRGTPFGVPFIGVVRFFYAPGERGLLFVVDVAAGKPRKPPVRLVRGIAFSFVVQARPGGAHTQDLRQISAKLIN